MSNRQVWLTLDVRCHHGDNEYVHVQIERDTWDAKSPEGRDRYVGDLISSYFCGEMYFDGFDIIGGMSGKFELRYRTGLSIDLTVAELDAANCLNFEWVAKGYPSREEMLDCEGREGEEGDDDGPEVMATKECLHA